MVNNVSKQPQPSNAHVDSISAHGGGGGAAGFSALPFLGTAATAPATPESREESLLICVEALRSPLELAAAAAAAAFSAPVRSPLPRLGVCCAEAASASARRGCSDEPRPGMYNAGERSARAEAEGWRPARCTGEQQMATGGVAEPESGPDDSGSTREGR